MITQEIGSLAKPNWRVKYLRGLPLSDEDFQEIRKWDQILGTEFDYEILKQERTPENRKKVIEHSALQAIRFFETAGLDIVFDGEQFRTEMYEYPVKRIEGFEFVGHVRSFDNKYYRKAAVIERPRLKEPYHVEEFVFTKRHATKKVKVPVTGPYALAEWTFNEYYMRKHFGSKEARYEAKKEFVFDLAKEVLRPNLEALIREGAEIIQIDEPAATTKPDELPIFVEAFNEMVEGLQAKFVMHICYSDYSLLFPHILEMKRCEQFLLEFANRDDEKRSGYQILHLFKEYSYDKELGLGVVDVHSDFIEPPELIRDRIVYAANVLSPEQIYVNPDCGLRTRTWDVAYQKLKNMVKGTRMAEEVLGLA